MKDFESKIIDRLNGELGDAEWQTLLDLHGNDPECQELYEEYSGMYSQLDGIEFSTPTELQTNFDSYLSKEIEAKQKSKEKPNKHRIFPSYLQQAAIFILLLAVGLLIGLNVKNEKIINDLVEVKPKPQNDMLQLLRNDSSSDRIKAVNMSYTMPEPNSDIIDALIRTLHEDKSDNVRLAAAEALSKFENNERIRSAFIYSLEKEKDELLQITLINILANIGEKNALPSFDKIIDNDHSVKFVKDEAQSGKLRLISTY